MAHNTRVLLVALILIIPLSSQISFPRCPCIGKTYEYVVISCGADSIKVKFYYYIRSPNSYYLEFEAKCCSDTLKSTFSTWKEGHWKMEIICWQNNKRKCREKRFYVRH